MQLAVFLPNWIGDVVMATPALRALRKDIGSGGRMLGVMRPYVADVLAGTTWFDDFMIYEKRATQTERRSRAVRRRLVAAKLDAAILFPNSFRTAWMAWRSGAGPRESVTRTSFETGCSRQESRRQNKPPRTSRLRPSIPIFISSAVRRNVEPPRMELATTPADEAAADAVWSKLNLPPGDRVVVLNTGGAFGAAKDWPTAHFAALARRIANELDRSVLINCGPSERDVARRIVATAGNRRVVSLAEEPTPIGLTKACVRRARLLVTTDSGPRFFAVAFGVPVVTLFGPTDPELTTTHFDREVCLSLALDCQPCMKPKCPLGHRHCMTRLTLDTVLAAVERLLELPSAAAAA